jgi:hypothetical protein
MHWLARHPHASPLAGFGLGDTGVVRDLFQTALYAAERATIQTGRVHVVLTQADAAHYLPRSRFTLSNDYPGWAVAKSDDVLMAVPDTVMRYTPDSLAVEPVEQPPRGSSGRVTPSPAVPTPTQSSSSFFGDNTLRAVALVGGVMLGMGVVWWITR